LGIDALSKANDVVYNAEQDIKKTIIAPKIPDSKYTEYPRSILLTEAYEAIDIPEKYRNSSPP
jgi:hypothetical protein